MPSTMPGRRAVGRGGILKPWEKTAIEGWLIAGMSVMEVYAECLDNGIQPPVEQALYRILNTDAVQEALKTRQKIERENQIARAVDRTRERQDILNRIRNTAKARADHYGGFAPGGEEGLIVLSDKKTVRTGVDDYDTVDIYKTDTGLIEQWRGVISDQEKADEALRRNLRTERDRGRVDETHEQDSTLRALEIAKRTAEAAELEAQTKRNAEGGYAPPTFPAVIVERLPDPVRPASVETAAQEEDEIATPAMPTWESEDFAEPDEKQGTQEAPTGALGQ